MTLVQVPSEPPSGFQNLILHHLPVSFLLSSLLHAGAVPCSVFVLRVGMSVLPGKAALKRESEGTSLTL